MKMNFKLFIFLISLSFCLLEALNANPGDWPIYKGNIYFTGNNDEIIIKNNNLKWLFQGDERVFNPVVSEGRVYFTDAKSNVYCVDEEYGKMIWKINLNKISAQFKAFSRSAGKVKYPLIKDNILFLSDPIAIYAINKKNGNIFWARTGMRQENKRPDLSGRLSSPMIDGIYADPVILEDSIYYGTRNNFISRDIIHGREKWNNESIKTYSGYPTFYDDFIFTQSMDYGTGSYQVHCLSADSGRIVWSKNIPKPVKIFPPVIYKNRVYIPSNSSVYCLDLKSGEREWSKEYEGVITSNPGFTDRSIIFVIDNSRIIITNPDNGNIIRKIETAPKSGPYFVTIRDQVYIAYNKYSSVKSENIPYGIMKAVNFSDDETIWQYKTPFPGAVSQPSSSNGIMFLPSGNYLYAIGTEYYARVVEGGSGHATVPDKESKVQPPQPQMHQTPDTPKKIKTRKMQIAIKDKDNKGLPADVEIKKREKGKLVYSAKKRVNQSDVIEVPEGDNVELLVTSDGYVPKKEIVNNKDNKKNITLDKIEKGKLYTVNNIQFEINRAYLKKESIDILDKLIRIMKQNPDLKVEVRGHTDSTGEADYNLKLSERRADSVIEYMIKNGISPERVNAVGFGETKPIASNDAEEGRAKNRRTEFYFPK
ncbi:MAG: OmpA family protein [Spirochaetes bacterium]|nr:OmpA family protein [Spirochaetota bacterium]